MINKILKKSIYSVWVITITAGLVLAADLWIGRLTWEPITKSIWDTLVTQLETNTDEIAALKTAVSNLQASSWNWIEIWAIVHSSTNYDSWHVGTKYWCYGGYWDGFTRSWSNWNCNDGYTLIRIDIGNQHDFDFDTKTYACVKF
jgi:hypothetical protein